jgi:membrane protein YqaA with SNARE-associated domain
MKNYWRSLLFIFLFVGLSVTVALTPTDTILDVIGSDNAYILMFCLGLIGGVATFVGIPYHLILMSLAAGGLAPIPLGIATALGVMSGDSLMYIFGRHAHTILPARFHAGLTAFARFLTNHPRVISPLLFTYGACSPFSNDFIVASLSIAGYSYWRTIIPLALGNIVFNVAIACFGAYAYSTLVVWF